MATASPATEQWDVTVSFGEQQRQYRLPPQTTIFAVRSMWAKDTNATPNTIELISQGQRLEDDLSLAEVGETYPDTRLVQLTARSVSNWTVIVTAVEDEGRQLYMLQPHTLISVVKSRWAQDTGISADTIALHSVLGVPVEDDQSLADVGELHPGSCLVKLTAERTTEISIEVFRGPFNSRTIAACLSKGPECLLRAARELFGIPPGRPLRLRTPESVLEVNVPLRDQGVTERSVLQIELEFRIQLRELWTNDVQIFNPVFSSEEAEQLRSTDLSQPQRVVCGMTSLDTAESLIEALMPHRAWHRAEFSLQLHIKKDVAISVGRAFREINVWPTVLTGSVGPRHSTLMHGDLPCPRATPICTLSLPDHGLLHSDPVGVCLKLSSGRRCVTRAPLLGAVADVRAAARAKDRGDGLILKCGDRAIADDANLPDVGVKVGAEISVHHKILDLSVFMGGRIVSWCTARRSLSFSDIAHVLYGATNTPYSALDRKTFFCVGCGRGIRKTEEEFQAVPVACCRVQSLRLAETAPRKRKDAGTQGARLSSVRSSAQTQLTAAALTEEMTEKTRRIDDLQSQLSDLQANNDNLSKKLKDAEQLIKERDAEIKKFLEGKKALTEEMTEKTRRIDDLQSELSDEQADKDNLSAELTDARHSMEERESEINDLVARWPDSDKAPRRLYVQNCTRHRDGDDFRLSLRLPVTGRDLRAAVAAELGVSPQSLRLLQWSGTGPGGRRFVHVRGADGVFSGDCSDAGGEIRHYSELPDRGWRDLDDDAAVTLAPGRLSVICVFDL